MFHVAPETINRHILSEDQSLVAINWSATGSRVGAGAGNILARSCDAKSNSEQVFHQTQNYYFFTTRLIVCVNNQNGKFYKGNLQKLYD